ncbi:biotin--[acetyl-CoA-carboxylase] ligase [Sphingomonas melonis]|uniref:biotin--[biotin carboxyl-carrier protein] ligase n=1 Tax=Sphingomonas melonis TaxID=152682 RepID=A0A7Y9FM72_9SPHN|nr:biotin--[acetyl-CoA-carboxylase] ligase [Sphingomonas melonis]NYD89873.1 BirA family biotin operon repressor/biotin-[acetyl-CoA-carboxylase] ligase [Sphingomonas melonis]
MTIRTVAETGSTNADMLLLARQGAGEGLWLRAERQTAGKGRLGRSWVSEPGNLYTTTLVRLRPTDPAAATLALVAAVALHQAVGVFMPAGRAAGLKWPNDLLLDGAKLSGILLERSKDAVAVGIGVNLAHHPDLPDRATTSLAAVGAPVDPATFIEVLADAFGRWLAVWRGQGLIAIRDAWLAAAHPVGTALSVRLPDGRAWDGLFDGLDPDGALILRLASGERHVIHAADVFLLKD